MESTDESSPLAATPQSNQTPTIQIERLQDEDEFTECYSQPSPMHSPEPPSASDTEITDTNSTCWGVSSFVQRLWRRMFNSPEADHHGYNSQRFSMVSELADEEEYARRQSIVVRLRRSFERHYACKGCLHRLRYHIDPNGRVYLFWMGVVSFAFFYNALVIPLRVSFDVYSGQALGAWLFFDYLFDIVYLLDIILVQLHVSFRVHGVLVSDLKLIAAKYMVHWRFWLDILSLIPLDIFYIIPVLRFNALLRLPRLLKIMSTKVFQERFESRTHFPHMFRMMRLVSLFLYIIHLYTCAYHLVSMWQGLGSTPWVYDGNGTAYVRCFYWAIVTVVTSHNLDRSSPSTVVEYITEMAAYLIGVFVLALIIGEIRNIAEATRSHKAEAYRKWDRVKEYLNLYHIPKQLQDRMQSWYDNVLLTEEYLLDENELVDTLPVKMKADLAIHIHLDTLSRVSLFRDCDKSLLYELVLKLRPLLFVPGDLICRKGEISKEMYIVNQGLVQVIGGADNEVLVELGPGAVFGEISLLGVVGGNRRTVHVRSKGFSKLFVLYRNDLHNTLLDYPEAQEALFKRPSPTGDNEKTVVENHLGVNKGKLLLKERRKHRRVTPAEVQQEAGHVTSLEVNRENRSRVTSWFVKEPAMTTTSDPNSLSSMASIETGDVKFQSQDSLIG